MEREKGILGYVKELIETCPFLEKFEELFTVVEVEGLPEDADTYSIEPTPCDPVLKRFIDGSAKCQFQFIFASRGVNVGTEKKLENNRFYENLEYWFRQKSREMSLPDMPDGNEALRIEAMTGGYVYDQTETKSQYRIQCRLVYLRRN